MICAFDLDLDLKSPRQTRWPKSLSDYGHAEPQRGTECWGEDFLVTFVWAGIPVFTKVTRRQGGTLSRRYRRNGYLHSPNRHRRQASSHT
ncbi:hypothetical protein FFI16_013140 [Pseudomonas sp. KBS0710]|nr:hypothetical protein FFI16_013140 [Pseudomonas sp. KBS0710]